MGVIHLEFNEFILRDFGLIKNKDVVFGCKQGNGKLSTSGVNI